jgi:glutathione S-transferase
MKHVTLYGSPFSLYTGRARSYLIKAGIPYREVAPVNAHFSKQVLPLAGGRRSMPTIELPDGQVVRDGVAIIDYFEAHSDREFSPPTPKQRVISLLFDVIGAEGMLRPAMHYRWNFPEENLNLLRFHFEQAVPRGPKQAAIAASSMDQMRAAGQAFGAIPETFDIIENHYLALLEKLENHFALYPYLLGNKPSVGDFGLIAPFYGHLGRDTKPSSIMKMQAIRVFRWIERMNRPEPDIGEYENQNTNYLADDLIPETLIEVLKHIALDFVPETRAASEVINAWLQEQQDLVPGTQVLRGVGMGSFELQDKTFKALAQPFRFYLLKRLQDDVASMDENTRSEVVTILQQCNMSEVLDLRLEREIGRINNLEVWL